MAKPSEEKLNDLARLLGSTEDCEFDCEQMLACVGAYLEAVRDRSTIFDTLRPVAQHLGICPECHEEFIALLKAEGLDPSAILPS